MSGQMGVIHEIGDLGLGFDPLSPNDAQALRENENIQNQSGNDDRENTEGR